MGTHACSRCLTFPACSRSPSQLSVGPPLSKPATTMNGGGGRDCTKKPPPPQPQPGAHPRYIPRRGGVLKGIVRGKLGLISQLANPGGRRVRPAPAGGGGDGAEQGK